MKQELDVEALCHIDVGLDPAAGRRNIRDGSVSFDFTGGKSDRAVQVHTFGFSDPMFFPCTHQVNLCVVMGMQWS